MAEWTDHTAIEDRTSSFFWQGMKTLWKLLDRQRSAIVRIIMLQVVLTLVDLVYPFAWKVIIDIVSASDFDPNSADTLMIAIGAVMVWKVLFLALHHFIKEVSFIKSVIDLENLWPVKAQSKLLSLSLNYHEKENIGKKVAKITKGCDKMVDILCRLFWEIGPQLLFLLINCTILLIIDFKLGLIFIVPFPIAFWLNLKLQKNFSALWEEWESKKETAIGIFCQSIINTETVQNFVQEDRERVNLSAERDYMTVLDTDICVRMRKYWFAIDNVLYLGFGLTLMAWFHFWLQGESTLGTLVYLYATGRTTMKSLSEFANGYMRVLRNLIAVMRMNELLEEEPDIKSSDNAIIPDSYNGLFTFDQAVFTYPGKETPVLQGLNIDLSPNEMIALVGRSGEGKTTVVKLLSRMYDIQKGHIRLDGIDIKDLDLGWLRRKFAIVKQDVEVFDGTIGYNIAYPWPNATPEEVMESLKAANLDKEVLNKEKFPDGLETEVGEKGIRLSGGQRQRVGLARAYLALLHGAQVLILDEATSSLDTMAEIAIQEMIDKLRYKRGISIVAIAHRLSTIQKADTIYVIDNGKVSEKGSHEKLLKRNGLYSRLVELQSLGEIRD